MIRDFDFIRECLLKIEQNAEPLEFYPIRNAMISKNYDKKYVMAQLHIMEKDGLFDSVMKPRSGNYSVNGLSKKGYDFLETIRNDAVWKKTKKEVETKRLPKTLETFAQVAGIFAGEVLKHWLSN